MSNSEDPATISLIVLLCTRHPLCRREMVPTKANAGIQKQPCWWQQLHPGHGHQRTRDVQADTFDPQRNRYRLVGRKVSAEHDARVFLHDLMWKQDPADSNAAQHV